MPLKMKYVMHITIIDPDTQLPVEVQIYKMESGGMVGIDTSFIHNTDLPMYSPYDLGVEIEEAE